MKEKLTIISILISFCIYSQNTSDLINVGKGISQNSNQDKLPKEWFSNIEIEFGVNNEIRYDYALYDNNDKLIRGKDTELDNKTSYGFLYSINYPIFNKLTLGAVTGFQYQTNQKISAMKVGGIIRYHFVNYENVNINLMTAYNIALTNNIESGMGNVRIGLQFPIKKSDNFNINLNIFSDYNYFEYKKVILNEIYEKPSNLIYRSYGFSLGIQF